MAIRAYLNFIVATTRHEIAKRNPFRAIYRFARLQISTRLLKRAIPVPFVNRTKILARAGSTGANGNYYFGLHEFQEMAFVLHYLRAPDLFVDVGANVGSYTILSSGAVGARTICFEPVPTTLRKLEENVSINHLQDRVSIRPVCLGREAKSVQFTTAYDTVNHISADRTSETMTVAMKTVDQEITDPINLMKIDAEGFDGDVLLGAVKTLRNEGPMAVVIETVSAESFALLARYGFAPVEYSPYDRTLTPLGDADSTIFVRDFDHAQNLLKTAPSFDLNGWGRL